MTPDVNYPYMPDNRRLKYAPADQEWVLEAKRAREECAGDPLYPVGIVIVRDGEVLVRAGNGFNKGPNEVHVCPRIVEECPSGTGYDLCSLHDAPGHAEQMAVKMAKEQGIDLEGADAYMYGHWWACEPCWTALIDAGVRDLYVTDDAHERFSRKNVFAETLNPSVGSAYIAGAITNLTPKEFELQKALYESVGAACDEMGVKACIPHRDNGENKQTVKDPAEVYSWSTGQARDCHLTIAEVSYPSLGTGGELEIACANGRHIILLSKKGKRVSSYVKGNPSVAYHLEYEDINEVPRKIKNILKQL